MIRGGGRSGRIAPLLVGAAEAVIARAPGRRLPLLVVLVTMLSLGALASAGPAAAVPREFFGLAPQAPPPTSDVQRMGQGRVGTVRLFLNWASIEQNDDEFDWSTVDRYVGDLAAAGIRPVPFAWGVPRFVNEDSKTMPVGPANDEAQWQEFLREAVERYGPGGLYWTSVFPARYPGVPAKPFEVWQVWNEQNAPKHTHPLSPASYARLVQISDTAIASRDPNAQILLGGMFGQPTGEGAFKAWKFLKAVYKTNGVKESFDAIALHPYSPTIGGIKDQVNRMRKVLKKNKDKKTRLWVTEIGWGSHGASTSRLVKGLKGQAKLLKKSFKLLKKQRKKWKIGGVMWYTWRDLNPVGAPCDWCASAGLFGQNGFAPKPAWKKYVRLTGGS